MYFLAHKPRTCRMQLEKVYQLAEFLNHTRKKNKWYNLS